MPASLAPAHELGLADPTLTPLRPPTSARPLGKGGAAGPQALTVRHGARRPR